MDEVKTCQDFHDYTATNRHYCRNESGTAVFFKEGNGYRCYERLFCRRCGHVIEIEIAPRLASNPSPKPNNDALKKPIYIHAEKQVVENFS